jgi:hypothetical protein
MTNLPKALGAHALVFSLGGAIAACSSSSVPLAPEPTLDGGGIQVLDGSPSEGAADAGAPHDAATGQDARADGGATGDGSASTDAATGEDAGPDAYSPPPPGALCSPTATWQTGTVLSVSTSSDDDLDAVTPDELSIVWTVGSGATATIEYADRASNTVDFGTPQTLAAGSYLTDRAAISYDGLRLVVVNADGQGFTELTRTAQTAPGNTFGSPTTTSYANLNGTLAAGLSFDDPVLSADDNAFYYSVYGSSGATATVYRAARLLPTDPFSTGSALTKSTVLAAQGSLRCRPTAISSDEQTLFFWDEITSSEKAAWIDESTGAFDDLVVDLGTKAWAAPDTACDRLYYSAEGAASIDLFVSSN